MGIVTRSSGTSERVVDAHSGQQGRSSAATIPNADGSIGITCRAAAQVGRTCQAGPSMACRSRRTPRTSPPTRPPVAPICACRSSSVSASLSAPPARSAAFVARWWLVVAQGSAPLIPRFQPLLAPLAPPLPPSLDDLLHHPCPPARPAPPSKPEGGGSFTPRIPALRPSAWDLCRSSRRWRRRSLHRSMSFGVGMMASYRFGRDRPGLRGVPSRGWEDC